MNKQESIVYLNPYLSILTKSSDSVVLSVSGKIKKFKCDVNLFNNIIHKVNSSAIFSDIVRSYSDTYPSSALERFLDTLIQADVLLYKNGKNSDRILQNKLDPVALQSTLRKNQPLFIGNALLINTIQTLIKETIHEFSPSNLKKTEELGETDGNYSELVDFFKDMLKNGRHTSAIVCPDKASLKYLVALNQACLALHIPFILTYFNGKHLLLGPTVIPWKSPCYACLIQHRLNFMRQNSSLNLSFNNMLDLTEAWPLPTESVHSGAIAWAADLIFAEMLRLLRGDICPQYLRRQVRIPLTGTCDCTETTFTSLTTCPVCSGLNKRLTLGRSVSPPVSATINLKESTVRHTDGGLRTNSAAEARKILGSVFDKLGLAVTIKQIVSRPLDKILPTFHAQIEEFYHAKFPFIIAHKNQWGKGLSPEQAFLSGSFELIERICADYYGNVEMVRASYREVQDIAVNVENRIGTLYCDYGLDRFDENMPIDWVWGYSLTTKRPLLVPASMVYLTRNLFLGNFHAPTSSGLAAGTSMEDAILQGLYETIEHDSWMIYQANAITPPRIQLDSIPDSNLREIIEKIEQAGYQVIINYLRNDLEIPVFRTWLINEKNYVDFACNGYGANLDPLTAITRSITEAKLSLPGLQRQENLHFHGPYTADLVSNRASLFSLYQFMKTDILSNTSYIQFSDIENKSSKKIYTDIERIIGIMKTNVRNSDMIIINLTQECFNIPVIKILAVGLQTCFKPIQCAPDRLFKMPKKIGLTRNELQYIELFNGIYPH